MCTKIRSKEDLLKIYNNTKDIINKTRLKRDDIAWMGIELKGTNAIVKVVKATSKPDIVNEEEYCNIVSDKNGIITKINAQNGTIAVKVGDTVNVGTTLINGWMEGKYTGIRYVHAKGEIQAKVWHTKSKKIHTYGGRINKKLVPLNGKLQKCETFNGNIVLIPHYVHELIGFNDPYFHHSLGDLDYGMRANKAGIPNHCLLP